MKVMYFDCFSGVCGATVLGALLDLGVDVDEFIGSLSGLGLNDRYELVVEKKTMDGITGTEAQVRVGADGDYPGKNLTDILTLIENSDLKFSIKDIASRAFRELARAEAKAQNVPEDIYQFSECDSLLSMVHIVGSAVCMDLLGIERVYSSQIHDGKGFVKNERGISPVPAPAVVEMLKDSNIPFILEDVEAELVTPAGMAFVKTVSSYFGNMPAIIIDKVGYGMVKRDMERFKALRVVVGELFGEKDAIEEFAAIEGCIDVLAYEPL